MNSKLNVAILLNYICIIITNLSSILLTPLLISGWGNEQYGLYIVVFTTVLFFSLTEFGFGNIIINHITKYRVLKEKEKEENFLGVSLIIYTLFSLIAVAACSVININSDVIFAETLSPTQLVSFKFMFWIMTANTFVSFFQTFFFCIIAGCQDYIVTRSILIIRVIARTIIIILLVNGHRGAESVYIMELCFSIITAAAFAVYAYTRMKIKIKIHFFDGQEHWSLMRHTAWAYIYIVLENVYWNIGNLIMTATIGPGDAGIFSIAMTFCLIFTQLTTTVSSYFMPKVTEMVVQGADNKQLTAEMINVGRILTIILTLAVVGFGSIGKELVTIWIGPQFEVVYSITLIIFSILVFSQGQIIGDIIVQAQNRYGARTLISFVSALTCGIISYFVFKEYGLKYSYLGIAISALLFRQIITTMYYRHMGLNMEAFYTKVFGRILIVAAVTIGECCLLAAWHTQTLIQLVFKAAAVALMFMINVWIIYLTKEEKKTIQVMMKRVANRKAHD